MASAFMEVQVSSNRSWANSSLSGGVLGSHSQCSEKQKEMMIRNAVWELRRHCANDPVLRGTRNLSAAWSAHSTGPLGIREERESPPCAGNYAGAVHTWSPFSTAAL